MIPSRVTSCWLCHVPHNLYVTFQICIKQQLRQNLDCLIYPRLAYQQSPQPISWYRQTDTFTHRTHLNSSLQAYHRIIQLDA